MAIFWETNLDDWSLFIAGQKIFSFESVAISSKRQSSMSMFIIHATITLG